MSEAHAASSALRRGARRGRRHRRIACPGSRSTPLALALAAHPGLPSASSSTSASAGFFALGLARTRAGRSSCRHLGDGRRRVPPAVVEAAWRGCRSSC